MTTITRVVFLSVLALGADTDAFAHCKLALTNATRIVPQHFRARG
jgi:hypothetical protein